MQPGTTITYTIRAYDLFDGFQPPSDLVITDDLSQVLNHATFVEGSIVASQGTASLSGTTLTWEIPVLDVSAALTYRVTVDGDAHGVTIRNVVTAPGSEVCVEPPEPPQQPEPPNEEPTPTQPVPSVAPAVAGPAARSAVGSTGVVRLASAVVAAAAEELPPECLTTTHRTPGVPPAVTGFAAVPILAIGLLILLAGAAAVALSRRRQA
nr:hypothetical protein [Agromyces protaetiae]